jgi:tRNA 2-thiouridine synthesizing protein A
MMNLQSIDERHYSLDIRGYVCPYPELLTLKALHSLSIGDVLEVILDNPPSVRDIPIGIEKRGYKMPEVYRVDKETWKIRVQISK